METLLRAATANDLPDILEIVNHNILNSTAVYDYDPKTLTDMQMWLAEKYDANWPVIVAEQDGKVIGYGSYGPFRVKIGYRFTVEHSVYAADNYKGKGIGRLLLTRLIALAREGGYHNMIGGIDADNTGSIEFHRKFGFTDAGTIKEAGYKFGRWLDLTFMQLILS
jgi:L-amino acid N-acyltransferase YncA